MVGVTGALIGGALIGGATSIIGGSKAAKAQKQAAQTAAAAQDRASEVQKYIFDVTRGDYAPYREVGASALYKLADMYGVPRPTVATGQATGTTPAKTAGFEGFQASPGYEFRVSEATKAIERSAAARGALRSGATMDALQRRVQGVASDEYERYADRLAQLAGVGQAGAAGSANAGANYASGQTSIAANQGQLALAAGNARASGYANTTNAINSGVQNLTAAYLYGKGWGG